MNSIKNDNFEIFFESGERETADVIAGACKKALGLIKDIWGLSPPKNCRIFIMTSFVKFFLQSAPWKWRILLLVSFPFWYRQVKRMWQYSGAWTQRYGRRVAIGIKSPRILEKSDRSIGEFVFVKEPDTNNKIQHFTCHELVHACAARLRLPMWLNEGIAMFTVDRFMDKQTIKMDTINLVKNYLPKAPPRSLKQIYRSDEEKIAYHTVRGYWIVRYVEKNFPGLFKNVFSQSKSPKYIVGEIVKALKLAPDTFWEKIDEIIVDYFKME